MSTKRFNDSRIRNDEAIYFLCCDCNRKTNKGYINFDKTRFKCDNCEYVMDTSPMMYVGAIRSDLPHHIVE